jgi:hypothetical protein
VIDYYVLRINLNGVSPTTAAGGAFLRALEQCLGWLSEIKGYDHVQAKYYPRRAHARCVHKNEKARFINAWGGREAEVAAAAGGFRKRLAAAYEWQLRSVGVASSQMPKLVSAAERTIVVTGGPLLRSQYHGRTTHMPQSAAEFHADTSEIWKEVAVSMYGTDHGLRLVDHSGRHGGCAHARNQAMGAGWGPILLRGPINAHFRWSPEGNRMQIYYTGLLERAQRLRITAVM